MPTLPQVFRRRRRIRQYYHADADAATYAERLESALSIADDDAKRTDSANAAMANDAATLDSDTLDAAAVGY